MIATVQGIGDVAPKGVPVTIVPTKLPHEYCSRHQDWYDYLAAMDEFENKKSAVTLKENDIFLAGN